MKPIAHWYQCPDCHAWLPLLQLLQSLLFLPMQAWWTTSFSASAPLPWEKNTRKLGNNCSWVIWMQPAIASWRRWKIKKVLSKLKLSAPNRANTCTLLGRDFSLDLKWYARDNNQRFFSILRLKRWAWAAWLFYTDHQAIDSSIIDPWCQYWIMLISEIEDRTWNME